MFTVVDSLLQRKVITLALYVLSEIDPSTLLYLTAHGFRERERHFRCSLLRLPSTSARLTELSFRSYDVVTVSAYIADKRESRILSLSLAVDEFCERGKNEA